MLLHHNLSGGPVSDPLSSAAAQAFNEMLTGGGKESPERTDRIEFFSDVFDKTLQKYSASDQGQKTIDNAILKTVVPVAAVSIAAFFVGYLMGKKRG